MLRYFCFLAVILSVKCALAPFIKPCKAGDNPCILESAQAAVPIVAVGIPALGVDPLDPMRISEIKSSQGGLQLTFTDTVLTGMKNCKIDGIKNNLSKNKQLTTIKCTVEMNGNYKLSGKILVLPIEGEGKYNIKIRDIVIKSSAEVVTVDGADGKPHWHIKSKKHSYQVNTGATFTFDNLFNGNKVLAAPVEEFVNQNWRDVMTEVAPPIVKAIVDRVEDGVEQLYKAVPAEELYIK